ncbi:hypothetical protein Ga0123462_1875 [Mariprofundus ferrinatatus]|uniref:Uncharacterized protein n=1 Tax=Mariprofundus ferrinatatus TaxID=1921087 RepID=A0A2K8L602_9PROT|nr:hypothetical protein [Mariprofundus ferrinatatus]ATX82717.1 hypothetical protein Ga0123462_1875 [Mariprofundus ferrinatatus]
MARLLFLLFVLVLGTALSFAYWQIVTASVASRGGAGDVGGFKPAATSTSYMSRRIQAESMQRVDGNAANEVVMAGFRRGDEINTKY